MWWYERLDAKGGRQEDSGPDDVARMIADDHVFLPGVPAAEAVVISRPRSALSLAPGEPDQVRRLERFRAAHPEVIVLLKGPTPRAWADGRKIERQTLCDLLDDLEETFPPNAGSG